MTQPIAPMGNNRIGIEQRIIAAFEDKKAVYNPMAAECGDVRLIRNAVLEEAIDIVRRECRVTEDYRTKMRETIISCIGDDGVLHIEDTVEAALSAVIGSNNKGEGK